MGTTDQVTSPLIWVLAPNANAMSLAGTNTYIIAPQSGSAVVVDPGPDDLEHLKKVAETAGRVSLIILTHRHSDHTGGLDRLVELTQAPARAVLAEYCRDAEPLQDGEVLHAGDVELRILATPGHTSDSICVVLPDVGEHGAILTGDTILGGSTTMIDHPDGSLIDYLESLEKVAELEHARIYPAHGDPIDGARAEATRLRAHRKSRLRQIGEVLTEIGEGASIDEIVDHVYADAPAEVRTAAAASVEAQLSYLRRAQG